MDSGKKTKKILMKAKETVSVLFIALAIALPFRFLIAEPFIVKGSSMWPSLQSGEYLVVDKITYRFREPQRGEVVIIKSPIKPGQKYIKRIVGLPGEKIKVFQGGVFIKKGGSWKQISRPEPSLPLGENVQILGPNEYFVLGDNTSNSLDSRYFGPVPRKNIIGRAWIALWPPSSFGLIKNISVLSFEP